MRLTLVLTIILSTCYMAIGQQNIIPNGDFEEGYVNFSSELERNDETIGPGNYAVVTDAHRVNNVYRALPDKNRGKYLLVDVNHDVGIDFWCVTVPVTPRSVYKISVLAADLSAGSANQPELALFIDGKMVGRSYPVSYSGWEAYTWEWRSATGADTVNVCLRNLLEAAIGNDLAVDDISMVMTSTEHKPRKPAKPVCPYIGDTLRKLVHFGFNESVLTGYSQHKLDTLLQLARQCPANKISIIGHTDPFGDEAYNLQLSKERTRTISNYLISNGIEAERLQENYLGEKNILQQKATIAENIINRRVEFVFLEEEIGLK